VIRVHGLQDLVDLVLPILAPGLEPARQVQEESFSPLAPGGDRLKASVSKERCELGRTIEGRPSDVVPFRPLHPCDDTRPCLL